jgi:Gas vesicle synthesis protein GvpO
VQREDQDARGNDQRTSQRTDRSEQAGQGERESSESSGSLSGVEAARRAVRRVQVLTGIEPEGVVSLEPHDRGWRVGVEVVEMERIPNSTDVMAVYQVDLDSAGGLVAYQRTRRHYRGRVDGRE